jgi:hypothetical protein
MAAKQTAFDQKACRATQEKVSVKSEVDIKARDDVDPVVLDKNEKTVPLFPDK